MRMSWIPAFVKYASAFEEAYASDDFSKLAPYFDEAAIYEVHGVPSPLGGRFEGRASILDYFKRVVDALDRKFASREVSLVLGPRETDRSVWVRGRAKYTASGVPDLVFELEETATFDANGRIARLDDRYDDQTIRAFTDYVRAHGARIGLGGT
jgi:hypothetical protein